MIELIERLPKEFWPNARDDALATWARTITGDPTRTTQADVAWLRAAGLDDDQVFAATVFVALRLAFALVNNALGATPDQELRTAAPEVLRRAVADLLG